MQNTHTTTGTTSTSRSRWAAIGAAIAVTLGAGGIGISHAATDSSEGAVSAFFPIEPCRLASNEAILADSSITLDGWGESGGCDLPEGITGLAANVTAVGATQQTNVRFYAEGADVPDTANLNPSPGAPPTPNAVNITLNGANGQFEVYNRFGQVAVFIDVMGYYDDHTHDDRYYTEAEVDGALAASGAVAWTEGAGSSDIGLDVWTPLATLVIDVPAEGGLVITGSASLTTQVDGTSQATRCRLSLDSVELTQHLIQVIGASRKFSYAQSIGRPVAPGQHTVELACKREGAAPETVAVFQPMITTAFSTNTM